MTTAHRIPRAALAVLALGALLASACVVAARPAPPPPPPPRIMAAPDAVGIAAQFARSRGLVVEYTVAARLDRMGRWHVDLGGAGGRDRARVVLDGYSGRILHARLHGPRGEVYQEPQQGAPPPPPPQGGADPNAPPPPPPAPGAPPQPGTSETPPPGAGTPPDYTPPPPDAPPPPQGAR
ncbi:MAG TPA: hypothetical protein VFK90_11445 [Anaeromyxobacter sp.]|nr:hypothetical protein [Anaeromyxobacter sp.]